MMMMMMIAFCIAKICTISAHKKFLAGSVMMPSYFFSSSIKNHFLNWMSKRNVHFFEKFFLFIKFNSKNSRIKQWRNEETRTSLYLRKLVSSLFRAFFKSFTGFES